jgi:Family of unknown function (DUF6504)
MAKHFISEPIRAVGDAVSPAANNEPALPAAFTWRGETLHVTALRNTWRSTKTDRGDVYLKRHWFEFEMPDGRVATVYYDRAAKRGTSPWSLYSIENERHEG